MKQLLSYLSLILMFVLLSFYFIQTNEHLHTAGHSVIEVPAGVELPEVKIEVTQVADGSWLLKIKKKNFIFTPEQAGSTEINFQKGHAHLYVNDKKLNRLYGDYYHLEHLSRGENDIKVSLVLNNHQRLFHQGREIADEIQVNGSDKSQ